MSLNLIRFGKRYAIAIRSMYTVESVDEFIKEIFEMEEEELKKEKLSIYSDYYKDLCCLFWDFNGYKNEFYELLPEIPKLRKKIIKHNTVKIE